MGVLWMKRAGEEMDDVSTDMFIAQKQTKVLGKKTVWDWIQSDL